MSINETQHSSVTLDVQQAVVTASVRVTRTDTGTLFDAATRRLAQHNNVDTVTLIESDGITPGNGDITVTITAEVTVTGCQSASDVEEQLSETVGVNVQHVRSN